VSYIIHQSPNPQAIDAESTGHKKNNQMN